jgi:hypothetical protein
MVLRISTPLERFACIYMRLKWNCKVLYPHVHDDDGCRRGCQRELAKQSSQFMFFALGTTG